METTNNSGNSEYEFMRKLIIDNPNASGAINNITYAHGDRKLADRAAAFLTSEESQKILLEYFQARVGVMTSTHDEMRKAIISGGGMAVKFPDTNLFPIKAGQTLIFGDKDELRKYTGGMAEDIVKERVEKIQEELERARLSAERAIQDMIAIAQAKISGAEEKDIITPEQMRISVATKVITRNLYPAINQTRDGIAYVIGKLMDNGSNSVKPDSLSQSMNTMHGLCQFLIKKLEELRLVSLIAIAKPNGLGQSDCEDVNAFIKRARQVFEPFINGSYIVTVEQLSRMENFLNMLSDYYIKASQATEAAFNKIQICTSSGNLKQAEKIKEYFDAQKTLSVFQTVTRHLSNDLGRRAVICAYAGMQNRTFLDSVPPPMVNRAIEESGVGEEYLGGGRTDYRIKDLLTDRTPELPEH